jgi:hypothetical protein
MLEDQLELTKRCEFYLCWYPSCKHSGISLEFFLNMLFEDTFDILFDKDEESP